MKIVRYINIENEIEPGKTLVLFGPRRVGKTTLLDDFLGRTKEKAATYRGDEISAQHAFEIADSSTLAPYIGQASILAIDGAQAIPNIGQTLKVINDTMPNVAVVVAGSSSFELAGQIGEPLTGRKTTRYLFPIALSELLRDEPVKVRSFQQRLAELLVYGMYPNAITAGDDQGAR